MPKFRDKSERVAAYLKLAAPEMCTNAVMDILEEHNFFTHPGSTTHHSAYEGGGFDHVYNVACLLKQWTDLSLIQWRRERSPVLVGFWHDLCKLDLYEEHYWEDEKPRYKHAQQLYTGHGELSVLRAQDLLLGGFRGQDHLTEEERVCIWYHMGPYLGVEKWPNYKFAAKQFSNVLWVHHADMVAITTMEV